MAVNKDVDALAISIIENCGWSALLAASRSSAPIIQNVSRYILASAVSMINKLAFSAFYVAGAIHNGIDNIAIFVDAATHSSIKVAWDTLVFLAAWDDLVVKCRVNASQVASVVDGVQQIFTLSEVVDCSQGDNQSLGLDHICSSEIKLLG